MSHDQLLLLPPDPPRHTASTRQARLLTFNSQHASPARARRQAAWIAEQDSADITVITEVGFGPGGDALVTALRDNGYTSIHAPTGGGDYRTVLASRSATLTPTSTGIDVLPHRAPAATVTIAGTTLTIVGLYVPSRGAKEQRNVAKRAFQTAVSSALPTLVDQAPGPVAILGDLNVIEPGHQPHHAVFGTWEYDFYQGFAHAGLADAFRELHPDTVDHSWYGRSGRGFRFDHAFLTRAHTSALTECRYLHQPRESGLTDHAALNLTLQLTTAP